MNLPSVCVTGATGLVGLELVRRLAGKGYRITAVVRPTSDRSSLSGLAGNLTIVGCQLTDAATLKAAMAGHDVVVHAAGSVDVMGSREEIFAVNVGGSRAALEAAISAGVKQFVHISSLSVITGQDDQYAVGEDAPLRCCGEPYADSKVEAEKLVMAEAYRGRIAVTALRPGFIYGPRERAWLPRLIESLASGKAVLIDGGRKETNVIYIGNLCRAIEASLLNERCYGKVYNLTDGQKVTKKQLFDAICDGLGLPRVTRSIPQPVARLACEVVSRVAPLLPPASRGKLSRFSRAAFRLAGVNQGFDISRAERDLDYTERTPFAAGMAETLPYFAGTRARSAGARQ